MKKHTVPMGETVRLGVMPPLAGLVRLYGQEICRAAQIACEEINEQGGAWQAA